MTEQRAEEVIKSAILVMLDLLPPDNRAPLFARISGQIMERLSKRDTQRVKVPLPREEP